MANVPSVYPDLKAEAPQRYEVPENPASYNFSVFKDELHNLVAAKHRHAATEKKYGSTVEGLAYLMLAVTAISTVFSGGSLGFIVAQKPLFAEIAAGANLALGLLIVFLTPVLRRMKAKQMKHAKITASAAMALGAMKVEGARALQDGVINQPEFERIMEVARNFSAMKAALSKTIGEIDQRIMDEARARVKQEFVAKMSA